MIEDFFHLPPVWTTPVVHLELWISPQIFEKVRNDPNGLLRGLGKLIREENQKSKISWRCPFKIWIKLRTLYVFPGIRIVCQLLQRSVTRRVKTMVSTENEAPSEGHAQVYRARIFKLFCCQVSIPQNRFLVRINSVVKMILGRGRGRTRERSRF